MAEVEVGSSTLVIHIQGADRFFALKSRLEVPLEHIARVEVRPAEAARAWHGLRMGGTNLPGVITAGRFLQQGEWSFWDVHDPAKTIAIFLHDERYARLLIGVDNPDTTARAITAAISQR